MEKFNIIGHEANTGWNTIQQPWGGNTTQPTMGVNRPNPGKAQPLTPRPEEEPDKREEDPSKKKRKKNIYEITC